jgi:hypothetical protein
MKLKNYRAFFRSKKTGDTWNQVLKNHQTKETATNYAKRLYGVDVSLIKIRLEK